jgi:hypothetical protein
MPDSVDESERFISSAWGDCPIDKCEALCCRNSNPFGSEGPCEYLTTDNLCSLELNGGKYYKPVICTAFPSTQDDIDLFNAKCAKGSKRCYLQM